MTWSVVIPIKRLDTAKSRLRGELANVPELALAFATDTVRATIAASLVTETIVVTADSRVAAVVRGLGARVIDDPGRSLNAAVAVGIGETAGFVAVLTGDLPSLRPRDLDDALARSQPLERSMVADRAGSGTTFLAARSATLMHPRFGADSRHLHERAGHLPLDIDPVSRLRCDVDTPEDLAAALRMGVGLATAAFVAGRAL